MIGNWKYDLTETQEYDDLPGRSFDILLVSELESFVHACLDSLSPLSGQTKCTPVSTEPALRQALGLACWDVVILDLQLGHFQAAAIVSLVRDSMPQCSILLICDDQDEEMVADLIRSGANMFLLRSNLKKLPKACKRAISKALGEKRKVGVSDSEGILKALLKEAVDSIVVKDAEGRYLLINPAGAQFIGKEAEEIIGKTDFELFTPETAQRIADSDRQVMVSETTQIIEDLLVPLAGKTRHFQAMKCVYRNEQDQVQGIINVVRDITFRKQAEKALQESEERFRMMADAAPVFIWMTDEQGQPSYFNKQWLDFTGQDADESLGPRWFDPIHPDDWTVLQDDMVEAFHARQPMKLEFQLRRAVDQKYLWILSQGVPRFNADGSFAGYIGSCINIHDQKMAQKALSDYTMKLHKSNQELEQFATVVSHDLQAPLRKVAVFSNALMASSEAFSDENRDYLERMQRSAQRMQDLIADLLDLSRINRRGQPFSSVHLESVVQGVVAELFYDARELGGDVTLGALDITLVADPIQLQQLLQNLIENGLKFHRRGVPPQVKVSASREGDYCYIRVEDNGIGFAEKHTQRIFGVFERLHGTDEYEGTGIGLAICKKIVERHHGDITVQSTLGEGTVFVVKLPLRHE